MTDLEVELSADGPTKEWVTAVCAVTAGIDAVPKTRDAREGNYKYRGIDDVIQALHPLLAEHSVVILPCLRMWSSDEWTGYKHGEFNPWTRTSVLVDYQVIGPDGCTVVMTAVGEGIDNSDKGVGKAMSYAFKAFVSQLFSIPTDDPAMDNEHAAAPAEDDAAEVTRRMDDLRTRCRELVETLDTNFTQQWVDWKKEHGGWHRTETALTAAKEYLSHLAELQGLEPFSSADENPDDAVASLGDPSGESVGEGDTVGSPADPDGAATLDGVA